MRSPSLCLIARKLDLGCLMDCLCDEKCWMLGFYLMRTGNDDEMI